MTVKTPFKIVTIQPESPKDDPLKLPYPYHISKTGLVGRQDFWRGSPYKLIGFTIHWSKLAVSVPLEDFWKNPEKAVERFPVFEDQKGYWTTQKSAISKVFVKESDV